MHLCGCQVIITRCIYVVAMSFFHGKEMHLCGNSSMTLDLFSWCRLLDELLGSEVMIC
jgi:hypothetical protein